MKPTAQETRRMLNPLPNRRKFVHAWDEIDYLYMKAAYWAHHRDQRRRAVRFLPRLKRLISRNDPKHEALLGLECMALIADVEGDLDCEIEWTKRLINRIQHGFKIMSKKQLGRSWADVRDELEILSCLYVENGQMDRAMATVKKCEILCKKHKIPFDAEAERKYLRS